MSEHLTVSTSDRGFDAMPPLEGEYGGHVRVYESSAAMGPHIWLNAVAPVDLNRPEGPTVKAVLHLTAENAWKLAEQIRVLVGDHYQGDARPEVDQP